MKEQFFISDLHLGHYNCIRFDNRPFSDVEEMDNIIIDNINSVVKPDSELYIGGDFTMKGGAAAIEYLKAIDCNNIILIRGNHDKWAKHQEARKYVKEICDYKKLVIDNNIVILSHYPMAVWDQKHRNSYHFYGHVHTNLNDDGTYTHPYLNEKFMENAFNIGCMMPYMNYFPRTFEEIINSSI